MKASKLGEAIERMTASRVFMWEHVPAGTPGKVHHDHELFLATLALKAELSNLEITLQPSHEAQPARSPS